MRRGLTVPMVLERAGNTGVPNMRCIKLYGSIRRYQICRSNYRSGWCAQTFTFAGRIQHPLPSNCNAVHLPQKMLHVEPPVIQRKILQCFGYRYAVIGFGQGSAVQLVCGNVIYTSCTMAKSIVGMEGRSFW